VCISDASRVLDRWHPLVHLALAGFEKEPISADFLRRYSATRHYRQSSRLADWKALGTEVRSSTIRRMCKRSRSFLDKYLK
jgi:hypothetical protein